VAVADSHPIGWWSRRLPDLPQIEIDWSAILERLMRPLGVVELEILANAVSSLAWAGIIGEIDLLILE